MQVETVKRRRAERIGLSVRDVIEDWNCSFALEAAVVGIIEGGSLTTPPARACSRLRIAADAIAAMRHNLGYVALRRRDAPPATLTVDGIATVFQLDADAREALSDLFIAMHEDRASLPMWLANAAAAVDRQVARVEILMPARLVPPARVMPSERRP